MKQKLEDKIALFLYNYTYLVWIVGVFLGINLAFVAGFWIVKLVSTPYKWLIDLIW